MVVLLLVNTAVAPYRCNHHHNHNPLCNVTEVTGKENDLKIYISCYIYVPIYVLFFVCLWKHLISDFWCVINAFTIFSGFSEASIAHMHHIPHVQWGNFRKPQASKCTVQLLHRHAMVLQASKSHCMWGNVCVCDLSWAMPWLWNPVFH